MDLLITCPCLANMTEKDRMELAGLVELACRLGASSAKMISPAEVSVEDDLAQLCREPGCENYGLSAGCPPHVSGPDGFRKLLRDSQAALVFKIDVPSDVLFSAERHEVFGLLHDIAAGIEQSAIQKGYLNSRAYAGGSCKRIFCQDQPKCRVVSDKGQCRNPDRARPSLSGFGVNVSKLMQAAGRTMKHATRETDPAMVSTGTLCGLVLIA